MSRRWPSREGAEAQPRGARREVLSWQSKPRNGRHECAASRLPPPQRIVRQRPRTGSTPPRSADGGASLTVPDAQTVGNPERRNADARDRECAKREDRRELPIDIGHLGAGNAPKEGRVRQATEQHTRDDVEHVMLLREE